MPAPKVCLQGYRGCRAQPLDDAHPQLLTHSGRGVCIATIGTLCFFRVFGWFPQLVRRNADHASKSNRGIPAKSALSGIIACAVGSGSALHPRPLPPLKHEPFNLLMIARSFCHRFGLATAGHIAVVCLVPETTTERM